VGFQARLKWSDQRRVFRMIPGLENAEFVRYGVMHRNTYLRSPKVLTTGLEFKAAAGVFAAGQLVGVEGYLESASTGMLAGINAGLYARGLPTVLPPPETMLGALSRYVLEADPERFSPMNANHGLLPPLSERIRNRHERGLTYARRALQALEAWLKELEPHGGT